MCTGTLKEGGEGQQFGSWKNLICLEPAIGYAWLESVGEGAGMGRGRSCKVLENESANS